MEKSRTPEGKVYTKVAGTYPDYETAFQIAIGNNAWEIFLPKYSKKWHYWVEKDPNGDTYTVYGFFGIQ